MANIAKWKNKSSNRYSNWPGTKYTYHVLRSITDIDFTIKQRNQKCVVYSARTGVPTRVKCKLKWIKNENQS